MRELKFKNKKAAVFGTYGWSGESTKVLREELTKYGFSVVEPEIKCNWNPDADDFGKAEELVKSLVGINKTPNVQVTVGAFCFMIAMERIWMLYID